MRTLANTFLALVVVVLCLWQLPWCMRFFFPEHTTNVPFMLYSSLKGDFIEISSDGHTPVRRTLQGEDLTVEAADSLLPFFFTTQLTRNGSMPDTILGYAVTPQLIQHTNIPSFRIMARDINRPEVHLWGLLESMPRRVNLEMPDDMFRFTADGIEFVDMTTNTVNAAKSERFTDALRKKGFALPALRVNGNCTTRKDYDEGYLLIDSNKHLYHLKMTAGRPYVKAITDDASRRYDYVFITEFRSRIIRGLAIAEDGVLYAITPQYDVVPLGDGDIHFDPTSANLTLMGNMLDWTLRISTSQAEELYALSAQDFSLLKHAVIDAPDPHPFGLHFTEGTDRWVKPRF